MSTRRCLLAFVTLLVLFGAHAAPPPVVLREVASGLAYPVEIAHAGDGSGRLFVVEVEGKIRIVRNGGVQPTAFLDLTGRVASGGESGLLGLAFEPDYGSLAAKRFFVFYTMLDGSLRVSRFLVTAANPDLADPASETEVITIPHPGATNHNGGKIAFGPDGYLYIGVGDGGGGGDPSNNAQNLTSLLGKLLRLDVDTPTGYLIPPGNPTYPGTPGARHEIWAYGLRNPWRFSFDRGTGDLYIADVGQNLWEEIDYLPAASPGGVNFGWRVFEGDACFNPRTDCALPNHTAPILTYGRTSNGGYSVTGGYVYRGAHSAALRGYYIYGDYGSNHIFAVIREGGAWTSSLLKSAPNGIQGLSTFGEGEDGEVYVASFYGGKIFAIDGPAPTSASVSLASSRNPSTSGQSVTFTASVSGSAGAATGTVNFLDGTASIPGCASVTLAGGSAACATSGLAVGSHSVTARYSGNSSYNPGTSNTLAQVVETAAPSVSTNVALASNGGSASASSSFGSGYPIAAVNNGERAGANWTNGGGWADGTRDVYPDWAQIDFNATKTIDRVVVYTLQDNWQSPSEPSDAATFTQHGIVNFTVQGWNGSAWVTLGSVSGNNLVKRTVSFTAFSTPKIRVQVTSALNRLSRITEIEAWTPGPAAPATTNVALASNGGSASASSSYSSGYPIAAINNGERAGANWSNGGGWADGTIDAYPDWAQIDFNATKTIDRVVVYTLQDNWQSPSEPSDATTFTQHGIVNFTVQGWNGSAWVTLGSVSGNNLVKRTVTFAAFSTTKIRVQVTNALNSLSRITEIEAWTPGSTPPAPANVALTSAGAVASASSSYSSGYPVAAVNNGERAGANWTNGGGWADGTIDAYPDWVQVDFSGTRSINRVVVYTLQDNWQSPAEPTDTMTFAQHGVVNFTVQGWNGSAWVTLASVTGNNLVKRTVTFADTSTTKIRVQVTNAANHLSRITEIEAWGN